MRLGPVALAVALLAFGGGGPRFEATAHAARRVTEPAPMNALEAEPRAEAAPPDSALDRFLGAMSDSTAAYFGVTAARPDTAGFDSALVYGLAHPGERERGRRSLSFGPDLGFSRVDGPVYGASAAIGQASGRGRLGGLIGWASGPNDLLGGATFLRSVEREDATWSLRLYGGRRTDGMDPDYGDIRLAMVRAFLSGRDYKHYLRRDGFEATLARETGTWRAAAGYRDMLETPISTHATWNLWNATPVVVGNLPATRGRNREFTVEAATRLPRVPAWTEIQFASSSGSTNSDFEYRRTRVAVAADLAAGRWLAIVPQVTYGRLSGNAVPQASFYLGGSNSMRAILGASRGGTGLALARLDLIAAHDLLALTRLPHPAWFPLQAGAFAAAGAAWGVDPFGGPARDGLDWPDQEHWVSEVGGALLWRPGLPDPTGLIRFSYAWPLGPARESAGFTASYSRALALVKPIGQ